MITTLGFAAGASLPLLAGAIVGVLWRPPRWLVAVALAFAAGALISAVSFELFEESYSTGGAMRAGLGFVAGATVFVVVDALLDRVTAANPTGFALLAGVTLDGVPENVALGVSLNAAGSLALLVAVFASNFPEALAGAVSMKQQGRLLPAAEDADDGVVDGADVGGVTRPRRRGARTGPGRWGGGLVVRVAWGCSFGGDLGDGGAGGGFV
ncbi:MAG: hypothetical protein ACRDTH_07435, partial [Pseudonocardiaceae bacterium]